MSQIKGFRCQVSGVRKASREILNTDTWNLTFLTACCQKKWPKGITIIQRSNRGRSTRIEWATRVPGIKFISDYQFKYLINWEIILKLREFWNKNETERLRKIILFLYIYIQKKYKMDQKLTIILIIYRIICNYRLLRSR